MVKNMRRAFKVNFFGIFVIFLLLSTTSVSGDENSGNVNNDDTVDLVDAILTLPILSGQFTNDLDININADVNEDDQIGLPETIFVLQSVSELRGEQPGNNADLALLTFCGGALYPVFNPETPFYFADVVNSVSEVTLTATAADPNASITINGIAATSGQISAPVHVNVGLNPILIVVTAEDGITTRTYTVNVFREEADPTANAYLSDLTLSAGTITPSFHPDTLTYTANVPIDIDEITITATTQENSALIMINGTPVPSGTSSAPISLVEGENPLITILVMAEDNSTTKIYGMVVTRGDIQELSTNAFLEGLSLSEAPLNESFFQILFNYTATVANETSSICVTPETDDPNATVTVNGTAVVSGQSSLPIDLSEGENTIFVEVTAQDTEITRTYDIIVTREESGPSHNADVSSLILSETQLNPSFAPGIFTYTATVLNYVDQITVNPTASNPSASITVNDSPVDSGQASAPIALLIGDNLITVTVTAQDGTSLQIYTINIFRHGAPAGVAATVYVVNAPASSANEFETLPAALEYLSNTLTVEQLGEIRIQTTQPMAVEELNFTCNVIITLDPGASTTITGPGINALVINANGSFDISGLNFVNTGGFIINSNAGFASTGSYFSGDTLINVGSSVGSLSTRSTMATRSTAGTVSKDLSFTAGLISGGLNVSAVGTTQKDIEVSNTKASFMGFSGTFTEASYLNLKTNLISELKINVELRNESKLDITGHTGLNYVETDINMGGNASATLNSNTIAKLVAEYKGLKGLVSFQNTFVGNAAITLNTHEIDFNSKNLNSNVFKMEVSQGSDAGRIGINLDGGFADKSFYFNAPDLSLEASLTVALTGGFKSNGPLDFSATGRATLTLDECRIGAEAMIKFGLGTGKLDMNNTEFYGKLLVQSLDQSVEVNASINHIKLHNDSFWNFASGNFILRFGSVDNSPVEVDESHYISIRGGYSGVNGLDTSTRSTLDMPDGEIHINNLNIKGSSGKPALFIEGVDVPVTIENSQIRSDQWAIVLRDVDGAVTIRDNPEIKGGISLDGDPETAGNMIYKQYTVTGNTISHSYPGMSCIQTHAIHDVLIADTDMTATGEGTHGVQVSGGKVIIQRGSIVTPGPEASQAIGVGESAGGHNGIVYAEEVSIITGVVQTGPKGYIKLTGNTFSNAKVVDYKEGLVAYPRLLNDPMGDDNEGLNPDEDIIGSLTDWNDDDHNCPDYPTKCDKWDEDDKECGCGEDGVSPPSDPGV